MNSSNRPRFSRLMVFAHLFLCLMVSIPPVYAQETAKNKSKNSLREGSWSIQYQISDDIGLKPFNGMMISLKKHISSHSAFRAGVDISIDFDDETDEHRSARDDSVTNTGTTTRDYNQQDFELNFVYMNYPSPEARVNMFWGGGPLVRYGRSEDERVTIDESGGRERQEVRTTYARSWALGILGLGGVEWFATEGLSFHAEYRASLAYSNRRTEYGHSRRYDDAPDITNNTETKSKKWNFDGVRVILGISFYF